MCDTLCAIGAGRTLFGKNSDRPPSEVQLVEAHPRRPPGGLLRTQYLELDDAGAAAVLGARPDWLWGFEHGVNEHRVAIGNEAIDTVDDPGAADPALIGMDLVRLGLERAENAEDAVAIMTSLLERYGQGGIANEAFGISYFSSFLVCDPTSAWILETSGRTWAAKRVDDAAAISNRITLTDDWTRASADVPRGTDFDRWRHPSAATDHADERLEASRACLATGAAALTPGDVVAHLRHHGERAWGAPGSDPRGLSPLPRHTEVRGTGVTVCMHIPGIAATTSSMVCELPEDPMRSSRAWVAPGSPCVSVYVPVFPPDGVPPQLGDPEVWKRFAALRDRAEGEAGALEEIRSVLGPIEAELWAEADEAAGDRDAEERFVDSIWGRVETALQPFG